MPIGAANAPRIARYVSGVTRFPMSTRGHTERPGFVSFVVRRAATPLDMSNEWMQFRPFSVAAVDIEAVGVHPRKAISNVGSSARFFPDPVDEPRVFWLERGCPQGQRVAQ